MSMKEFWIILQKHKHIVSVKEQVCQHLTKDQMYMSSSYLYF